MPSKQITLWGDTIEIQGTKEAGQLNKRFIVPPFSVLDARQDYWRERKQTWLALGIKGELGRGKINRPGSSGDARPSERTGEYASGDAWIPGSTNTENATPSTSIFDPVLCELMYTWFCPPGGHILDPFAGGSVRGIIAGYLGYHYTGIDLSAEQLQANYEQADEIKPEIEPRWFLGDSREQLDELGLHDFIFSCPPYYDLEIYGDDPRDLSMAKTYTEFLVGYNEIIGKALNLLRPNRFACFVVGDIRDHKGPYRNFVSDTIAAFRHAGAQLYNEAILVTVVGSLPIRIGKQFSAGRKLGKTHQNVLVFVKGDWHKAAEACGEL